MKNFLAIINRKKDQDVDIMSQVAKLRSCLFMALQTLEIFASTDNAHARIAKDTAENIKHIMRETE